MPDINIWGRVIPEDMLSDIERDYLSKLPPSLPTLEWVWQEMDRIWDQYRLDNTKHLSDQQNAVNCFYGHPVWLMNGIYTEMDNVSAGHRKAIAQYLIKVNTRKIADYGGGAGVLALSIVDANPTASVSIVEPFPSRVSIERVARMTPQVSFIDSFENAKAYDAVIMQDVLEHVDNPVELASFAVEAVKIGGYLVFANCFYPFIKCHLPATFYLRNTFSLLMKYAGLKRIGTVPGAEHAMVFQRQENIRTEELRNANQNAKQFGSLLNRIRSSASSVKGRLLGSYKV